jgi:hypothetical protein
MELDDLKSTWNSASKPQPEVTTKMVDEIAREKYQSKIKKIVYPEIIGSIVCLAAAVFITINFYKLNTIFLQGVGVLCILLLMIMVSISFSSLKQLSLAEDVDKPYAETLKSFARQQLRFYNLQKINITLGYLLLVTVIILMLKFFGDRDITGSKLFWILSFTIGYIFLLFFSSFVAKSYKKTLEKSKELLQALEA